MIMVHLSHVFILQFLQVAFSSTKRIKLYCWKSSLFPIWYIKLVIWHHIGRQIVTIFILKVENILNISYICGCVCWDDFIKAYLTPRKLNKSFWTFCKQSWYNLNAKIFITLTTLFVIKIFTIFYKNTKFYMTNEKCTVNP